MAYTGDQKREYQRKWLAARRLKALEYLGGKCKSCGTEDNLEFDHEDRSLKSFSINNLLSRRWDIQVQELDKCQLLCLDCHLEKTLTEMPDWLGVAEHGTHSKYITGCRCSPCREGHRLLAKEYRALGKKW